MYCDSSFCIILSKFPAKSIKEVSQMVCSQNLAALSRDHGAKAHGRRAAKATCTAFEPTQTSRQIDRS